MLKVYLDIGQKHMNSKSTAEEPPLLFLFYCVLLPNKI